MYLFSELKILQNGIDDRYRVEDCLQNGIDDSCIATGFFDGPAVDGFGATGVFLLINPSITDLSITNSKAEFLVLWCLLKIALSFGVDKLRIFGDSEMVINWAKLGQKYIHN